MNYSFFPVFYSPINAGTGSGSYMQMYSNMPYPVQQVPLIMGSNSSQSYMYPMTLPYIPSQPSLLQQQPLQPHLQLSLPPGQVIPSQPSLQNFSPTPNYPIQPPQTYQLDSFSHVQQTKLLEPKPLETLQPCLPLVQEAQDTTSSTQKSISIASPEQHPSAEVPARITFKLSFVTKKEEELVKLESNNINVVSPNIVDDEEVEENEDVDEHEEEGDNPRRESDTRAMVLTRQSCGQYTSKRETKHAIYDNTLRESSDNFSIEQKQRTETSKKAQQRVSVANLKSEGYSDEEVHLILKLKAINIQNCFKNISKGFYDFVTSNHEYIHMYVYPENVVKQKGHQLSIKRIDAPSLNERKSFLQRFNKFIRQKKHNHESIKQIVTNQLYSIVLKDFIQTQSQSWLNAQKFQEKDHIQTLLDFLFLSCNNHNLLPFLSRRSIKSENNPSEINQTSQ